MRQLLGNNQPVIADHGPSRGPDPLLAVGRQRDVCSSRVAAVERPFCLAVADDKDTGRRHAGRTSEGDDLGPEASSCTTAEM